MDAGDILLQEAVEILPNENAMELGPRLARIGAGLLVQALERISSGTESARPQIEADATYVGKLCKEDGLLDWAQPATLLNNRIRGYQPWPICYTTMPGDSTASLRIYRAVVVEGRGQPGEVLSIKGDGPVVAAGEQALRLLDVQPPGKKRMSGQALACGRYLEVGSRLGATERE